MIIEFVAWHIFSLFLMSTRNILQSDVTLDLLLSAQYRNLTVGLTLLFSSMTVTCLSMEAHPMHIQKPSIPAIILRLNGSFLRVL